MTIWLTWCGRNHAGGELRLAPAARTRSGRRHLHSGRRSRRGDCTTHRRSEGPSSRLGSRTLLRRCAQRTRIADYARASSYTATFRRIIHRSRSDIAAQSIVLPVICRVECRAIWGLGVEPPNRAFMRKHCNETMAGRGHRDNDRSRRVPTGRAEPAGFSKGHPLGARYM
jgi:hypothetical protein